MSASTGVIGERAKRVRHPLLLPIEKMLRQNHNDAYSQFYVKLRSGRACIYEKTACMFASAITKSSLYLRQNDKAHAHQITLLSLAP